MKNRKRKVMTLLLAFMLTAVCATTARCTPLSVTLANKTDAKVFVAFAEMSTGGDSRGDYSMGWWSVAPGRTRTIRLERYSPVCLYFFYATSKGGRRVWGGDAKEWVHPSKSFVSKGDSPIPGGKMVGFREFNVGTDGRARINFVAKDD